MIFLVVRQLIVSLNDSLSLIKPCENTVVSHNRANFDMAKKNCFTSGYLSSKGWTISMLHPKRDPCEKQEIIIRLLGLGKELNNQKRYKIYSSNFSTEPQVIVIIAITEHTMHFSLQINFWTISTKSGTKINECNIGVMWIC